MNNEEISVEELEELWRQNANICIDGNECIDTPFHIWPTGTPREEIWHWFDERHPKGVYYLIYELDGEE
jgi:hypothetical protein